MTHTLSRQRDLTPASAAATQTSLEKLLVPRIFKSSNELEEQPNVAKINTNPTIKIFFTVALLLVDNFELTVKQGGHATTTKIIVIASVPANRQSNGIIM